MRHVPENTELLLIGCLIESICTPRSKSNTLTPKTNSLTYWPRRISHVMNGIIFCVCKERKKMQVKKESQQNQSRWWIWSRLQQKARKKTKSESQIPLGSWNEQQPRSGRLVMGASSSDNSEWNIDEKWSSQEWKSGDILEARTVRPVGGQHFTLDTDKFVIDDDDMDSDTATEIEPFAQVTVILAQGEWSIAEDIGPFFKRCNAIHRQKVL